MESQELEEGHRAMQGSVILTAHEEGERLYGPECYSTRMPVKSRSNYKTYPPGYFEWKHKYRMQEQAKGNDCPDFKELDEAFVPQHKKPKHDEEKVTLRKGK